MPFQRATSADCDEFPELISYHIHVMFWPKDPLSVEGAMRMMNGFIERWVII